MRLHGVGQGERTTDGGPGKTAGRVERSAGRSEGGEIAGSRLRVCPGRGRGRRATHGRDYLPAMNRPVVIDLCAGRGGWTRGFLAEGYRAFGFDIERHGEYPGELVLQDVRTVDGRRMRHAAVIVASPPCPEFSRWDQPWTRAKNPPYPTLAIELVQACWRIAAEAGVPIILENVRGAQRFIGPARAH